MDDLKTLQPTVFPVVPRLLNRMFDKVSLVSVLYLLLILKFTVVKRQMTHCFLAGFYLQIFLVLRSMLNIKCADSLGQTIWQTKWMFLNSLQVFSQANTPLKRWLLDFAFRRKETELKNGVMRKDSMWDKLIFKKVQVNMTHLSSLCFCSQMQCQRIQKPLLAPLALNLGSLLKLK